MTTWAAYITDDLRARIRAGRDLPKGLTLEYLSQQYDVSLMPVRMAVNGLIEEQFLQKGNNGRLAINPAKIGIGALEEDLSRPEPPEDCYDRIANDLVVLSLKGKPLFVREEDTAERYRISRATVRQAFNRLAGVGMLEHVPRCGWRVRPFRQKELAAFLDIREVLELKALDLAWPRLADEDLKAMHQRNVLPKSSAGQPIVDNSLHAHLIEKADNSYIHDFFERHGKYYEALFDWELTDRYSAIETVNQHHAVLDAMLARDRKAAREALAAHIRFNHPVLTVGVAVADRQGPEDPMIHPPNRARLN